MVVTKGVAVKSLVQFIALKFTVFNSVQTLKELAPIVVTVSGMVITLKILQSRKIWFGIFVTLFPIVTVCMVVGNGVAVLVMSAQFTALKFTVVKVVQF